MQPSARSGPERAQPTVAPNSAPSPYVTPAAPAPTASWRSARRSGGAPDSIPTTAPVSMRAAPTRTAATTRASVPVSPSRNGSTGTAAPEAKKFGGTAGEAYDSCYHQACDTVSNLSTRALFELGDAAAHATMTLAMTKSGFFEDGSLRTPQARTSSTSRQQDYRGHSAVR